MHSNVATLERLYPTLPYSPGVKTSPLKILLVEDSITDAELTRHALNDTHIPHTIEHLKRGSDVIPFLTQKGFFTGEAAPDLILLDLGLPCEDGFEVLEQLGKLRGVVRGIPLVILTGYENFTYLREVHELCITDYLTKPCSAEKLREILNRIA